MKYKAITEKIIGAGMEVHRRLGNGFQELIYQRALEIELKNNSIAFQREYELDVVYKSFTIGTRRVDFLVENYIMVELKAQLSLEPVHLAQVKNYLEASELEIALLLNFGNTKLYFNRIYNNKK